MKETFIGSFLGYAEKIASPKNEDIEKNIRKLKKRFSEIKKYIDKKMGENSHNISYFIFSKKKNVSPLKNNKNRITPGFHSVKIFSSYQEFESKLNGEFNKGKDVCVVLLANEYLKGDSDIYYINLCQKLRNNFKDKKNQKISIIVEIINEKYYELLSHFANKVICVKKITPYILLNSLLQKNYLRVIKNTFYIDYAKQSVFSLRLSGNYSSLNTYTYHNLKKNLESMDDGDHIELLGFIMSETGKVVLNPSDNSFRNRRKRFKKILMFLLYKILMLDRYKLDSNVIFSDYKLKKGDIIIAFAHNYDSFIKKIRDIIKSKTEDRDK